MATPWVRRPPKIPLPPPRSRRVRRHPRPLDGRGAGGEGFGRGVESNRERPKSRRKTRPSKLRLALICSAHEDSIDNGGELLTSAVAPPLNHFYREARMSLSVNSVAPRRCSTVVELSCAQPVSMKASRTNRKAKRKVLKMVASSRLVPYKKPSPEFRTAREFTA